MGKTEMPNGKPGDGMAGYDAETGTDTLLEYGEDSATFGDRLVAARQGAGLRRKVLARKLGVKTATLRNWEEDRSAPRAHRLTLLSGMMGVPLIWLMTGQGTGPLADESDGIADGAGLHAALIDDFAAARAELGAVNRKLAGIERRLRQLLPGDDH